MSDEPSCPLRLASSARHRLDEIIAIRQSLGSPCIHQLPLVQDEETIGLSNRRIAVSNSDDGAAIRVQSPDALGHPLLGERVEVACHLVQHDDGCRYQCLHGQPTVLASGVVGDSQQRFQHRAGGG